jgi:hypothetical protein
MGSICCLTTFHGVLVHVVMTALHSLQTGGRSITATTCFVGCAALAHEGAAGCSWCVLRGSAGGAVVKCFAWLLILLELRLAHTFTPALHSPSGNGLSRHSCNLLRRGCAALACQGCSRLEPGVWLCALRGPAG